MKVALAQVNPVVGDIEGNTEKLLSAVARAEQRGADLVVGPELATFGYPPKDLLLKEHLVRRNLEAVERVAATSGRTAIVVGFAEPTDTGRGKSLRNAAALCVDGRVAAVRGKRLLPTYDVFDELRYFDAADTVALAELEVAGGRKRLGFSICEDLWNYGPQHERRLYHDDPIAELVESGAEILINIAASPFSVGKQQQTRAEIFSAQAARHNVPLVYVNQVGGNDDLVFDGGSAVFGPDGTLVAQARAFDEDLVVVDLNRPLPSDVTPYPDEMASVHDALVLGTRDYVNKCGFKDVLLGLSGGIDSAVTAAIAVAALGPERVTGVALPSRYSSDHSVTDAERLAANLGIRLHHMAIENIHRAMEAELAPYFAAGPPGIAEENVQARIRGNLLMSLSNKQGSMLLTTGNKSELAVGYCTLYGDMCGGLAVLSDVPKTMVYDLARYVNRLAGQERIPENSITKPPSAELKADQTDQDSLPPYDVLDAILQLYVEREQSVEQVAAQGFDLETVRDVARRVDMNEYKRKQAAVGLKVTSRAFGTGRRMPIAAKYL